MKQEKSSDKTENREERRIIKRTKGFKLSPPRDASGPARVVGIASRWIESEAENVASHQGSARMQEAAEQFFAKQNPEEAIEVLADRGLKEQATKAVSAVFGHLAEFAESIVQHLH